MTDQTSGKSGQQGAPKNPADPAHGRPQQVQKDGKADSFARPGAPRAPEDESRGKEGGVSPGAQQIQRDKFSGESLPRDTD